MIESAQLMLYNLWIGLAFKMYTSISMISMNSGAINSAIPLINLRT